jgi:hypothetical protein
MKLHRHDIAFNEACDEAGHVREGTVADWFARLQQAV